MSKREAPPAPRIWEHDERSIIQITPATGWYALYAGAKRDEHRALAGWALVEDPPHRYVVGLLASDIVELADNIGEFKRYVHESQLPVKGHDYPGKTTA